MRFQRILIPVGIVAAVAIAHLIGAGAYERPKDITKVAQLDCADCRVGVLAGYSSERVVRETLPHARLVGFHDFDDAFTALLAGRIEAFVYNEHVLNVGLRTYPNRFRILDEVLERQPAVVLVSKKRLDLMPRLNGFIRGLRASGVYDDMFTRWCQSDEYVPMPEIPEGIATNGVLRVGTSGAEEPSSFVDDAGNVVGFDIEFIRRFARFARMQPEISCLPDDEILPALRRNEIDLVVDDYDASEAGQGVLVSDGYFDSDVKVMVRAVQVGDLMLGSKRLGYTSRIIKDPRVALFVRGFLTTLAITILAALFGTLFACVAWKIRCHVPEIVQKGIDGLLDVIRLLPPPVVMILFASVLMADYSIWAIAVGAFAFWFGAFVVPVVAGGPRSWVPVVKSKLIELMQWTSIVGYIGICDLTMAADLVCGKSFAALGPLVSVAAAYCLMNWIVERIGEFVERKLA